MPAVTTKKQTIVSISVVVIFSICKTLRPCLAEFLLVEKAASLKSYWNAVCAYFLLLVHFEKQLN
jgi:hypothetical protein